MTHCFGEFLARGSPTNRQKLFQSMGHPSGSLLNTWPSKVRQPLKPDHIQLGNLHLREVYSNSSLLSLSVQPSSDDIVLLHFTSELKVNDAARVQFLIKAAHGFVRKLIVPCSSYEHLWSEQSKIGHILRTRRLHEGRRKIKQGSKEYDCADRFALLFLRHDIDETVASLKNITLRAGTKEGNCCIRAHRLRSFRDCQSPKEW